jgi:hypothetical protein
LEKKDDEQKEQLTDYKIIADILKGLTGVVIIAYLFGFLVVSLYMLRYHYISHDLIKARYLGAGVFYAFSMGISLAIYFGIQQLFGPPSKDNYKRGALGFIAAGVIVIVPLSYFLTLFILKESTLPLIFFRQDVWKEEGLFVGWFVLNYVAQYPAMSLFPLVRLNALAGVYLVIIELTSLLLFSLMVYPSVPSSFVGGKPQNVQLFLDDSSFIESLPFNTEGNYSEKLKLLDTTDKSYLLLIKIEGKDKLFELNKDLVKGVIYGVDEKPTKVDTASTSAKERMNNEINQAHKCDKIEHPKKRVGFF